MHIRGVYMKYTRVGDFDTPTHQPTNMYIHGIVMSCIMVRTGKTERVKEEILLGRKPIFHAQLQVHQLLHYRMYVYTYVCSYDLHYNVLWGGSIQSLDWTGRLVKSAYVKRAYICAYTECNNVRMRARSYTASRRVWAYANPWTRSIMSVTGESKDNPIVLESPISIGRVPVSPLKPLSSPES